MPKPKTIKAISYLLVAAGVVAVMVPAALTLTPHAAEAAARTYQSKGSQENDRNLYETCRLKKVERTEEAVICIYRRQSGDKDEVLSNEDPSAPCQRQFQCKRIN